MRAGIAPFRLMFPAAALLAAFLVPPWTLAWLGLQLLWNEAFSARWHGHEMIFGFALALVGGYLVARRATAAALALLGAWLAGRVAGTGLLPPGWSAAPALLYPALLVVFAAPPFLRAAKSPDNLVFAPLLTAFLVAELLFQLGRGGWLPDGEMRALLLGADLVALLLFAMGGRIAAAASSGALQRQGLHLSGMAQVSTDRIGVVFLVAALVADQVGGAALHAGIAQLVAAGAALRKLAAWRFWRTWRVPEVASLHLGYGWLALGLLASGLARVAGGRPLEAMHGLFVGGLGILAATVAVRTVCQRRREPIVLPGTVRVAVLLLALAALSRLAALLPFLAFHALLGAAVAWSAAWLLVLVWLLPACAAPRPAIAAR